jgi:hypothetical protein
MRRRGGGEGLLKRLDGAGKYSCFSPRLRLSLFRFALVVFLFCLILYPRSSVHWVAFDNVKSTQGHDPVTKVWSIGQIGPASNVQSRTSGHVLFSHQPCLLFPKRPAFHMYVSLLLPSTKISWIPDHVCAGSLRRQASKIMLIFRNPPLQKKKRVFLQAAFTEESKVNSSAPALKGLHTPRMSFCLCRILETLWSSTMAASALFSARSESIKSVEISAPSKSALADNHVSCLCRALKIST